MKRTLFQLKQSLNPLERLIQDATHAPAKDLTLIENIMTNEAYMFLRLQNSINTNHDARHST